MISPTVPLGSGIAASLHVSNLRQAVGPRPLQSESEPSGWFRSSSNSRASRRGVISRFLLTQSGRMGREHVTAEPQPEVPDARVSLCRLLRVAAAAGPREFMWPPVDNTLRTIR